ncbi:sensor domain-containing diguanylate cyclase [Acetobacterium wieringae]|uniref:sensor domain-containing diguanylate cyclase n=1 Tax=Acetobacterium wieringae TaxID=52694 RepID=UPI003158B12F
MDDTHALIAYLNAFLDEKKPPLPSGYADDPDFLLLISKLKRIQAFVSEAQKSKSENLCDLDELIALKKQLKEREEHHRLLIENASDIISTVNLDGEFTYISPSVERMTGYTVDEVTHHFREINYFLPETLKVMERTMALVKRTIARGERFDSVRFEQMQYTKNGQALWTDTVLTGVYDDHNQLKELLGVSRNITEQVRLREEIIRLSQTDKLTQLYNRSRIEDLLEDEYKRANRTDSPFAVIFLDVDHFKWVNDRFGHQAGDLLLNELSTVLLDNIRQTDRVGRWGGEEFLFILADTDATGALLFGEKIRQTIARHLFSNPPHITASLGVAVYQGCGTLIDLIARADDAMYAAKKAGRNQVQLG